jgi:HAMP domain-containing protein
MPEFGEALDRFAIVDFTRSEAADDEGGTISRQRYTLAPSRSGALVIPPLLVEFVDRRAGRTPAPEGEDAYELLTAALEFEVAAALPEGASLELRAPFGRLGARATPGRYRTLWLLAALVAVGAAAVFGVRAWVIWRSRSLRRSAYDVAKADLDALLMAPRPGERDMDAFFVQLSGIVRRYLENRFGLRSPELTTEEFVEELANSPDLVRSHQRLLREFLNRADLVKFAHLVPGPADVELSLESARSFLEATRGDLNPERASV